MACFNISCTSGLSGLAAGKSRATCNSPRKTVTTMERGSMLRLFRPNLVLNAAADYVRPPDAIPTLRVSQGLIHFRRSGH